MDREPIQIIEMPPEMERPLLIAGFDGWGNALSVSTGTAAYLVRRLGARRFALVDPDGFYRYDEKRPRVVIRGGRLERVSPPGGAFHWAATPRGERDLVVLEAREPALRWHRFTEAVLLLCGRLGIDTVITLGSLFDNVLHWDRIISGVASNPAGLARFRENNVVPVDYEGPGAIHTLLQAEGQRRGLDCFSLWCHCPSYLEGTSHLGLMAGLGSLLSVLGGFSLDVSELEDRWRGVERRIGDLVEDNPDLRRAIRDLEKAKDGKGRRPPPAPAGSGGKVIDLAAFLRADDDSSE